MLNNSKYLSLDTIAAPATAIGGALAVIRISGPRAFEILTAIDASGKTRDADPRQLVRARLHDPTTREPLDDAIAARFVAPQSYTGENVVELHVHGGHFLNARLLEVLSRLGARSALPGEFSFRAVRNGKMSLSQAHAVADLIAAANDGAIGLALEKLSGTQNRMLGAIAEDLRNLAVLGEIGVDFSDQDVDEVSLPRLKQRIEPLLATLGKLRDSYDRGYRIQEGFGVAFVGLPNAGKSSFFNLLLGEDRSIVSSIAGTTRDVVRERLTLKGERQSVTLRLEDTAGLRHADDEIEKIGIARSIKAAQAADLVVFIVDPGSAPEAVRKQWASLSAVSKNPLRDRALGIVTKTDIYSEEQITRFLVEIADLGITTWTRTSAPDSLGIKEAARAIARFCEQRSQRATGEILLTREDQLRAVESSIIALTRGLQAPEIDLFAADLKQALHALGPLIGETLPDDILGRIFSSFCIGK